jgi:hypothetical protein
MSEKFGFGSGVVAAFETGGTIHSGGPKAAGGGLGLPAYSAPRVVPPSERDNRKAALKTEDIRLEDRKKGLKVEIGRGENGGKIGAIKGKKSEVNQEESAARSTLVVMQPGRPRGDDQYVPYLTPKPVDKAGHTLFALDIPIEGLLPFGKTAQQVGKRASRIVINKNADRSAQISIESYSKGYKALKGKTDALGKFIDASSWDAITRETIEVSSFNVSEVQRVNISLHTLSTLTEEKITVGGIQKWTPLYCAEWCGLPFWTKTDPGGECCCFCCTPSNTKEICWTDKNIGRSTDKKVTEPFDLVSVTEVQFILRDASHAGEENCLKFVWRVQSIGVTETDLKYTLADDLALPCMDPTSTARTLANVIHYLNA